MATISKTGISNGLTVESEHITRIIDALDGTSSAEIIATGSFTGSFSGSFVGDGSGLTGTVSSSYAVTASYAENVSNDPRYITLTFSQNQPFTPIDGTTYFIGNSYKISGDTSEVSPPKSLLSGTIVRGSLSANIGGITGSDELAPVSIFNLDTNTSSSISNIQYNSASADATSNTSLPVNLLDRIVFKIESPTWSTNPTNVTHTGYVLIQI